ncbi:MAG: hypothetical protein JXA97_12845 [Anaerolineales bacterium]|nr:hypothetical protein [Anaerolineales bacterium]
MKERGILGGILAVLGALLGLVVSFLLFTSWYEPMQAAEIAAGRLDEQIIVKYIIPALSDFGILAGALFAVGAYGFFTRREWAWPLAVIANVLALEGSFFPMIPAASRGLPPAFGLVFVPNLVLFLLLQQVVRKGRWSRTLLCLFTGMAFVLSFMNGVASTDRMMVMGNPLYFAVQRLNWIASVGWGVATCGILLSPREWVRVVGMSAAVLEVVVGFPLGIATTINFGHFSMFFPAPALSLALLILMAIPAAWKKIAVGETEG